MGEIGIDRHTFLYDMQFWEVQAVINGYRRRDILKYQLLRLCAYMSCYSMRDNHGKSPEEWLPFSFEKEETTPISQEEVDELQAMMNEINSKSKPST